MPPASIGGSPWTVEAAPGMTGWQHLTVPGKSPNRFDYARQDGRNAIAVTAASSVSMLRSKIRIEPSELGGVRFSWKVPQLIAGADMALRDADDSPVRVVLVFEGERSRFSSQDALLSELVGIGIMSDSDNTRSQASAWFGPVRLGPAPGRPPS